MDFLLLLAALLALLLSGVVDAEDVNHRCNPTVFRAILPDNIQVFSFHAAPQNNVNVEIAAEEMGVAHTGIGESDIYSHHTRRQVSYCNITVWYTHPGQRDYIQATIALPLREDTWNFKFLMTGGAGWTAGGTTKVLQPVAMGFASGATNAGHELTEPVRAWGLTSEGNVNWPLLHDYADVAIWEAATMAKKALIMYFHNKGLKYSYFIGCSTGGRQGYMFAQKYPDMFDGIMAASPTINWHKLLPAMLWPLVMANELDIIPPACVLNEFTKAAITACDNYDRAVDGFLLGRSPCDFDPYSMVGQRVDCKDPNVRIYITKAMATLVKEIWRGPRSENGLFQWYGLGHDVSLTSLLDTTCVSLNNCLISPQPLAYEWAQVFLEKTRNQTFTLKDLNFTRFDEYFRQSVDEYGDIMGTDDIGLARWKARKGKLMAWHGMQDPIVMYNGTVDYHKRLLAYDPAANDYARLYLAPGVGHCRGGKGFDPKERIFDTLMKWVEDGEVPETIMGVGKMVSDMRWEKERNRIGHLCTYPKHMKYVGPDANSPDSFTCE